MLNRASKPQMWQQELPSNKIMTMAASALCLVLKPGKQLSLLAADLDSPHYYVRNSISARDEEVVEKKNAELHPCQVCFRGQCGFHFCWSFFNRLWSNLSNAQKSITRRGASTPIGCNTFNVTLFGLQQNHNVVTYVSSLDFHFLWGNWGPKLSRQISAIWIYLRKIKIIWKLACVLISQSGTLELDNGIKPCLIHRWIHRLN